MFKLLARQLVHYFGEKDDREWLLRSFPKHAICAEVGVYEGRFSELILRITRPNKLNLIDPCKYEADPAYEKSFYGGSEGQSQAHMEDLRIGRQMLQNRDESKFSSRDVRRV
jgi:hypothetical protein